MNITDWDSFNEVLATNLPSYQPRAVQANAAEATLRAFGADRHILAQLPTGSGKSFIACAVAYIESKATGRPVVYGTETKALQDQLANKDLPFLAKYIDDLRFAVLKGRANYLCMAKVDESRLKDEVKDYLDKNEDFSGEAADLPLVEATQLTTSSEECPGKKDCPFGDVCFAEKAKEKAKTAHIVVVNHAVIAADMAVKASQEAAGVPEDKTVGILPHFSRIILDEAHGWESSVTNALGGSATAGSYARLVSEIRNFLDEAKEPTHDVVGSLTSRHTAVFNELAKILARREDKRSTALRLTDSELGQLSQPIVDFIGELASTLTKVELVKIYNNDKLVQKRKRLVRRIENASAKLNDFILADEDSLVRWGEVSDGRKGDSLNWAPLDVSGFLQDKLWNRALAMLMSATLALGTDFSYVIERVGLDAPDLFVGESPFDYAKQAKIFIPQISVPAGGTVNQWRAEYNAVQGELVRAANGRSLLLSTSKTELSNTASALEPVVRRLGHKNLKQGDAPNKVLAQQFKDDEHSVLHGLASFGTGMDFQGDTLRNLGINKLPFPLPSDVVIAARIALADKKYGKWHAKGGFNGIFVPLMGLTLLQWVGRGVRSEKDRVLITIGDSRLYGKNAKPYGSRVMAALPPAPVTTSLEEAVDYLEGLEG